MRSDPLVFYLGRRCSEKSGGVRTYLDRLKGTHKMRSAVEQLRSDVPGYKQGGRVSFDGIQEKKPAILAFLERLANIELKLYPADFP